MGVRVLESRDGRLAAIYCSTSMWAFGPVFSGDTAGEDAYAFIHWLGSDPRLMSEKALEAKYSEWLATLDKETR